MKLFWFAISFLMLILIGGTDADEKSVNDLKEELDELKAQLNLAGYLRYSAYDLAWQSLHMAGAAACRGSTFTGGSGPRHNVVAARNTADKKTCTQICAETEYPNCDAEVSVFGTTGKAIQNGQIVGRFYNYSCDDGDKGGSEVSSSDPSVMLSGRLYFSYCCCRQ